MQALTDTFEFRGTIVVSISACYAEDPGSIPGRGVLLSSGDARWCVCVYVCCLCVCVCVFVVPVVVAMALCPSG